MHGSDLVDDKETSTLTSMPPQSYHAVQRPARDVTARIDWLSLAVVYFVTLVNDASRGMLLPSTWPYLHSLSGTKEMLGVFVSTLSFGRMLATIPLGHLSDNHSPGLILIWSSVIQIIGHLMYAIAPNILLLFLSRIIVGIGSGTLSVCRSHVARAIPHTSRTYHFAYLSALQFIGYAVLPGPAGLMDKLPQFSFFGLFVFNGFTYPAYALVIANIICIFLVSLFYVEPSSSVVHDRPSPVDSETTITDPISTTNTMQTNFVALFLCLAINVFFRGAVAQFEVISVPFLMEQYNIKYDTSSVFLSVTGLFGLLIYVFFRPIARAFSDRYLVGVGLLTILASCLPLAVRSVSRHLPLAVYVFCLGLTWSVAYPVGQTAVLSLFSKLLAGLPSGGFLGLFSMCGSVSRLVFAAITGWVWSRLGREAVFVCLCTCAIPIIAVFVVCYQQLALAVELVS